MAAAVAWGLSSGAYAGEAPATDFRSFAQGAVPVAVGGDAEAVWAGMEQALAAIDGNASGFSVTPRPGNAATQVSFVYRLPAITTFTAFAVPNVTETPSPSQTFFRTVEIAGSADGSEGPFSPLADGVLAAHSNRGEVTRFPASSPRAVSWVRLTLRGGIRVERDQTFFEFSEIIGEGRQEPVPLLEAFTGKWHGRGVPSSFILTVLDGEITGVRSTNGAPFALYNGQSDPALVSGCSERPVRLPTCGDNVHGINFEFDSAVIRAEPQS